MACCTTGVRIPSVAMSSSATPSTQPSVKSSGSTFESVFAGISEQGRPDPRPTTRGNRPTVPECGASQKSSSSQLPQPSATPSTGNSAGVSAPSSKAASQSTNSATNVQTPSEATPSSVVLPPSMQVIPAPIAMLAVLLEGTNSAAPPGSVVSNSASTFTGLATPARAAGKQQKAMAPSAQYGAGVAVTAVASIPNQRIIAAVDLASWQESGQGQRDKSSTPSAKAVGVIASVSAFKGAPISASTSASMSASMSASKSIHDPPTRPFAGTVDAAMTPAIAPADMPASDPNIAAQDNGAISNVAMDIPLVSISPNSDAANPSPGQPISKASSSHAAIAKNPDLMNVLDAGKGAAITPGDTSFRGVASDAQAAPSSQVDALKAAVSMLRPQDSGASQAQSVAMHLASHETAAAQHTTNSFGDTTASAKVQEAPVAAHAAAGDVAMSSGINAAKLIQTMGETEMHVGMHSTEFGDISIRTTMSQQQMVTQISLNHTDLSQAISAHVATVQAKLGENYGLHTSIEVNNQGSSFSGESGNSSRQEHRSHSRFTGSEGSSFSAGSEGEIGLGGAIHAGNGHELDIRI